MSTLTQPLRDEHQDLLPQINALQTLADHVGTAPAREVARELDDAIAFLAKHLLVHAQAEERVLYPAVEQAMNSPKCTATMRRDHVAIARMTTALQEARSTLHEDRLTEEHQQTLRRLLYGLHTLVRVHLAKEEEVFLPALDAALTQESAQTLFAEMERTAHELMAQAA